MWALISKLLPMILQGMGGSSGASGSSGGGIGSMLGGMVGGGQQQSQTPQAPSMLGGQSSVMPSPMMQSRQMPSYGNMVNQMLQRQRGY